MSEGERVYWDSSCFICLLNKSSEKDRRLICDDIVRHALRGEVEIWTSTWTIVEVIRPKKKHGTIPPWPDWAEKAFKATPEGMGQFKTIWDYFYMNTNAPSAKLSPEEIAVISGMFQWDCIKKAYVDQRIAEKAVELARDLGLHPADSVHAATAILTKIPKFHRWDRDYSKVADLIDVQEPKMMSDEPLLVDVPVLNIPS